MAFISYKILKYCLYKHLISWMTLTFFKWWG